MMLRSVAALLLGASLVGATTGALAAPSSDAPAPAAKAEKPISPFILCDGRTGHVGAGETIGRLLLLSATAGLSEAATAKDDVSRRLNGLDGVAACDAALAREGDPLRRSEIAEAKAIHLIEAEQFEQALAAARDIPVAAGPIAQEWGFQHTREPRILLLQSYILLRLRRLEEADRLAVRAIRAAPYDVALLKHATPFMELWPTLYDEKRAALDQAVKVAPEHFATLAETLIAAGQYREAEAVFASRAALGAPFALHFHPEGLDAFRAVLLMLAGDADRSNTLAAQVRAQLPVLATSGGTASDSTFLAGIAELQVLQGILRDLQEGHASEARATFRAHGAFLLSMSTLVETIVTRLRAGAPDSELTGALAQSARAMREERITGTLAGWAQPEVVARLYAEALLTANAASYLKAGEAVWKPTKRPRMLTTNSKLPFELVDTLPWINGLPASDAAYLYAATIARARGASGFAIAPFRRYGWEMGVRFGNIGDPGFPSDMTLSTDAVIAQIGAYMPKPPPRR